MQKLLTGSDTVTTALVAPTEAESGSIVTATVSPDLPKERMCDFVLDLTEVEGEMLTTFRVWTSAQSDPALRAELITWDEIHLCTNMDADDLADFMTGWEPERIKAMKKATKACRYLIALKQEEAKK